jgi:voltage-gated potassium channel
MKIPRYSAVELLIALGLLFISAPLVEDLPNGELIESLLLTFVMVSAVVAIGARRGSLVTALILLVPAVAGKWLNHLRPNLLHPALYLAAAVIFFGFVVARLMHFVVRSPRVDTHVLCAGVSGFLLLGLLWATGYLTVARLNPAAFTLPSVPGAPTTLDGFSAFYLSFVTLTTVGYGDITPVSRAARMLAATEAITGMFYMAVLISRLVSLHSSPPPAAGAGDKTSDR